MRTQRIDLLEKYILQKESATLDELCEKFQVSKNTIRRDVKILSEKGEIKKVYGGVAVPRPAKTTLQLLPYETRYSIMPEEKKRICALAADYVKDGDFIYIDTGTTCLEMIDYLCDRRCTILTNSLRVALKAVSYPNLEIISMPGRLKRETLSYVNNEIDNFLKTYNIGKAFMACSGVTIENGATNATIEEYIIKKAVIERSASRFLLADHTKFGHFTLMTYCPLEDMDHVVTDRSLDTDYQSFFQKHQIQLSVAP